MTEPNTIANNYLFEHARHRKLTFKHDFEVIYPWWRRCKLRVLLITDGGLSFGMDDFGLSAFVNILINDRPWYADFEITLAHLRSNVSPADMMQGAAGIARRITGFRFDEPTHFDENMYDQVWMFGVETYFHTGSYAQRNGDRARYPVDRLGNAELVALSRFMDNKGGVFATGDHAYLGRGLCGSIKRVRNMRLWDSTSSNNNADEVSMDGARRNDTNQIGRDAGSQFSDQSDDVPQTIDLKLYSSWAGFLRNARYPHPVLCGRNGRIDVLPDHPHEGECREPPDLNLNYDFDGSVEYPDATDGTGKVASEVIAHSHVPAGNNARTSKAATIAHTFGAISAYDGHRANVGRVVCDATWHHFINVNLIGIVEGGIFDEFGNPSESPTKHSGFLSSADGLAALDKIKNYFTNIAVWIARPSNISCFRRRFWWDLLYIGRLMEATLPDPNIKFESISTHHFLSIGIQARDVLGRLAGQCQTLEWIFEIPELIEFKPWIIPWDPWEKGKREIDAPLPVFDPMPLVDLALGAALVGTRQALPYPGEKLDDEEFDKALEAGRSAAKQALGVARKDLARSWKEFSRLMHAE